MISLTNPVTFDVLQGHRLQCIELSSCWASLVARMLKHLPAKKETPVPSLGWEDSLEKEMATHSSTLAWEIPWTEEADGLLSMGSQSLGYY